MFTTKSRCLLPIVTAVLAVAMLACGLGAAQGEAAAVAGGRTEPMPEGMKDIGIEEHPNALLPLDLPFEDERGQTVQLRQYFQGKKPVILQLGYYECPMLCGLVSQGLVESLKELDLKMGGDFDVVSLSINPDENHRLAYLKKGSYIQAYGRPEEAVGMHLLVGKQENIRQVTEAAGFKYKWVESAKQYSHPAALIICTPEGRISRYLYGVNFPSKTLRLSLVEASQGKIGTTMDQILLVCFHYDSSAGRYSLAAINLMRLGGIVTVIVLVVVLWRLFRRERRADRMEGEPAKTPMHP